MKPRLSPAATVVLPSFSPDLESERDRVVARLLGPHDFEQRHDLRRVEEMEPDHALGALGRVRLRGDGQRGGVGRDERVVLDELVDLFPHLELLIEVLRDRLDHQVRIGEIARSRAWA